ncbi:hypothetical protein PQX77_018257 [Marasmius sp. AFHP31]|nr:hypothetical protein PQX77_018257 [Marasmius sp. AFHP31]
MLYAILPILNAAVALSQPDSPSIIEKRSDSSTRAVYGIIWGCLTTIVACTWLAIHPNVPNPNDSRLGILSRRAMIMGFAILVPEYTTVWAFRQWSTARRISRRMTHRPEWTITHSFFLVMGGFMLVDKTRPVRPLLVEDVTQSENMELISLPILSEREIQDRSKGDGLSKTFILLQTTWFLIQVLARVISGLPVTELELVTVAFATLNVLAYIFWYNKPLNVDCPIPAPIVDQLGSMHFSPGNPGYSVTSINDSPSPDILDGDASELTLPPPVYGPASTPPSRALSLRRAQTIDDNGKMLRPLSCFGSQSHGVSQKLVSQTQRQTRSS